MEKHYFAHSTALIDDGVKIGEGTKIWHFSHILEGSEIGKNCSFGQNCVVGPRVNIADGCKIQNNISIYEGVECEENVFLGPSMVFTNVINPRAFIIRRNEFKKTLLKKGCSIGANATIVCGVCIGEYAFVGAGSVIIHDVPAYALMVGNPARQIGWVDKGGNRMSFNADNIAIDSYDGTQYILSNQTIRILGEN
ncbi:N-acetyltransferase [Helicobacter monodelphidis]|uniref:acyltransferase n=1 Tax=Helicobacter sp. 15-1451 TaxID=2004995 RepID=UPI000DCF28F6|nr:acyltransferase [Helicobacter sp. 15-1451]RAX57586.1 N-acetyltransferase [Helicobacter sp. 15-1451]